MSKKVMITREHHREYMELKRQHRSVQVIIGVLEQYVTEEQGQEINRRVKCALVREGLYNDDGNQS